MGLKQKPIPAALTPFLEGKVLLLDKPIGWTSFNMVQKVRHLTKVTKVGHAGTLDPLATGLLIICTGKFTKQINTYMGMTKEYTGSMVIGATTPTYDLESEPENFKSITHLSIEQIKAAAVLVRPVSIGAISIKSTGTNLEVDGNPDGSKFRLTLRVNGVVKGSLPVGAGGSTSKNEANSFCD